jgi:uncharacterized protein YcbK (DUF882 family)
MHGNLAAAAAFLASAAALAQPPAKPGLREAEDSTRARYAGYVRAWHAPDESAAAVDESGRPLLALFALNTRERIELRAASERGGFAASDLDRAAMSLREPWTGNAHPVEPRLLDLVYQVQRHFNACEIRVVSGYRTPRGRSGSNHGKGRAMDFIVPGAPDDDVARYARTLGFVGVGIYPVSGFIHLDVRDRSYFWSDASAPGRRNRERGILGDLAASGDKEALSRGEKPPPPFAIGLRRRRGAASPRVARDSAGERRRGPRRAGRELVAVRRGGASWTARSRA